jgi:phage FluMu gp28-like protein
VTIDEAAFHANVKDVIAAVNALLIWGGRIRLISSHNGAVNPFNVLILEARAGKSPFVVHRYTFDDAIDGGLYERVCAKQGKAVTEEGKAEWYRLIIDSYGTDDEARQQELHCIPAQGSGAFLSLVLIEARMREGYELVSWRAPSGMVDWEKAKRRDTALEFCETLMPHLKALPQDLDHYLGEDFGRHADRTDIAPCFLAKDLVRHFPLVVELASVPFDAQALILWYIIDRLPRFRHGILDANGNGMALAEAARQKYGASRITELKPSEQFYLATMPLFKSAFEQDGIMVPRHADIRDDLGMLRLVNGVAKVPAGKRRTGSDGEARHGDSGMSLVYGYAASLVSTVPVEFQGLGQLRDTGSLRDYIDGGAGGASRHGADLSDFMSLGG